MKNFLRKNDIIVEKSGGDKYLWFLRSGGITSEPDFAVKDKNGRIMLFIEFQYGNREDLEYFDFKLSKVSKKKKKSNKREPYKDRIFLCVLKNSLRYAFITPEWIAENGKLDVVPAWGSRPAYRVPREKFEKILQRDDSLKPYIEVIDAKIEILNFQFELISIWENEFSKELQRVIDEKKLIKIIPETLEGFFKVCFVLDHLNRVPENVNLWLVYLLSYLNNKLTLKEVAMLVYSLDYLYSKFPRICLDTTS